MSRKKLITSGFKPRWVSWLIDIDSLTFCDPCAGSGDGPHLPGLPAEQEPLRGPPLLQGLPAPPGGHLQVVRRLRRPQVRGQLHDQAQAQTRAPQAGARQDLRPHQGRLLPVRRPGAGEEPLPAAGAAGGHAPPGPGSRQGPGATVCSLGRSGQRPSVGLPLLRPVCNALPVQGELQCLRARCRGKVSL